MKHLIIFIFLCLVTNQVMAQADTNKVKRVPTDTSKMLLNLDAVYNRPFLQYGKVPIAIGGYAEANTHYAVTDGVTDGLSFQMRRMTLFLSSTIHRKVKFLTEIEFEDGTKEINLEFAAIDFQFHHLLNFRGGIIMNPIGAFNQNHDGPRWEFVDRPISATQLLPATFSNVGFGFFGKVYKPNVVWAYELYLTNGLNDNIISNTQNKTFLPATKLNQDRFEESFNGEPLTSAKTSFRYRKLGEIGISYMGGVYNKFQSDGLVLDKKRRADVFAVDFNTSLPKLNTVITAEFAWTFIDVPNTYSQQFGKKQHGGFIDIVQPLIKKKLFGFEKASLNAAIRVEYVDWNVGKFKETGGNISDEIFAIVPAISFRTSPQTVLRLNYRYEWRKDLLGNPFARTAAIQFGVSSYF
ncbi:hypothetical protein [Aurantibacillus circumpalustris]|uniref:hypothetical protein n=1 Tax=Aurantibacillus circumpalustris TaxID=3036359 RepID=UPI00295BADD5|nr:hypothetical protein [Aurantibacillus circumpalustris]